MLLLASQKTLEIKGKQGEQESIVLNELKRIVELEKQRIEILTNFNRKLNETLIISTAQATATQAYSSSTGHARTVSVCS